MNKSIFKKQSLVLGAFLLAAGGIIAKIIGAFYKVPLTHTLGANGIGVYHLIFPLYSLILVLVSGGVSITVSRLVALERVKKNTHNENIIFKTALIYVVILSLIFTALIVLFSENISELQGNVNAHIGYIAIAPSIFIASLIAVVRGFFQGHQNMFPTSISNILEQLVKMVSGLILASAFIHKGIEYAVLGATLGVTISEFFAFLLMVINFIYYKKKNVIDLDEKPYRFKKYYSVKREKPEEYDCFLTYKKAFKKIVAYSFPATLTSVIIPMIGFIDSFLVINLLIKAGFSTVTATSLYGIANGIVSTLISVPIIVVVSLSTAIIPNISSLQSENNIKMLNFRTAFVIKLTFIFALPCFVLFLILSPDIIQMLYFKGLSNKVINEFEFTYKLLMIESVSIIYMCFLQIFTSILQSINKPYIPFFSLVAGLFIRTILIFVLVPNAYVNIFGTVLANIVFLFISSIINLYYLKQYIKLEINTFRVVVCPVFASAVMGMILYVSKLAIGSLMPVWLFALVFGLFTTGIYLILILSFQTFNQSELRQFKRHKTVI